MTTSLTQRIVKNLSMGGVDRTPMNPDLSVVGLNNAIRTLPLTQVTVLPGAVVYADLQPLLTSDGAQIPATEPGVWNQIRAAGRMG